MVKNPPVSATDTRDAGLIPESERSPGGGNGNPLQYSCLRIPWTEEPGGLHRESGTTEHTSHTHTASFWLLRSLAFVVGAVSKLMEGEDLGLHSIHLCHALGRRASNGH